jgi:hypothetical protein
VRQHSQFAPRGFDVSPLRAVVKARFEAGFDERTLAWNDRRAGAPAPLRALGGAASGNRAVTRLRTVRRVRAQRSGH